MVRDTRLEQATAHQSQRQWSQAMDCYKAYLQEHPNDTDILHELAIAAVKAQHYHEAHQALLTLATLTPDSAIVQNHLANVLKKLGYLDESEQAYQQALRLNPQFVEAYNNLGILYFNQQQFEEAAHYYQQALSLAPDFTDALYNLGMCYIRQERDDIAIKAFERLLNITPQHIAAHYHLGKLYFKQDALHQAVQHFTAVLTINEKLPEIHSNLAHCYVKQENWSLARTHYEKSLDLEPNNFDAHYNLAVVAEALANIDLAIQHYQHAAKIQPNDFAVHNNLGVAYLKRQNLGFALKHLETALTLQPDNENLRYNVNALKQDPRLDAAPTQYIKNLFDAYAQNFEKHIQESLDYQVPEKLLAAALNITTLKATHYDILDVGCGTGLAGALFKPYAKKLVGIDLSEKMIDIARAKDIYDDLIVSDIEPYLTTQLSAFDIILAADVFVYIGKLDALIRQASLSLTRKGLLIFSTETCDDADYKILQSGRFAHSETYLKKLAKEQGFKILYNEVIEARMQYDKPVMGRVMVMRKKGF